jgi:outer membrane receptor protein involved in Fe transport
MSNSHGYRGFAHRSVALTVAMILSAAASAQETSAPDEKAATSTTEDSDELEQVIVTGSRIRRPEFSGTIPGAQVTSNEIEGRAFTNAIDVLNDLPIIGPGAGINGNNGGQPGSLGSAFVDLLDLGTQRTLTLVNGRRFVTGNQGTLFVQGNATGGQVDVNSIPVSLIERVDVLTVGGAAAYGSDAIAGVVNYILKDDYEGTSLTARYGETTEGDGASRNFEGLWGTNFADGRGNFWVSGEFAKLDGIQADERSFRAPNQGALTNFANGSRRNSAFAPALIDIGALNNGAFLRAADDGIPGTAFGDAFTSTQVWPGGVIFNTATTLTGQLNQVGPFAQTLLAGNTQLVTGVPGAGNPAGATGNPLSTFAPSALPTGVTSAQVFTAFGVTPPPGLTAAQANTLAINVLQANRPTVREYLARNPNTPINAILGTLVAPFPDIANTNPATNLFFPRVAVPIRFDNSGNIESWVPLRLSDASVPSTAGAAFGGDGFNAIFNTVLRVDQERKIANARIRYDFTDSMRIFSENLVSNVTAVSRRNGASANTQGSGTIENAALIMNVNNPYLDAGDRAALAAAGITGNFVLSRTNQDINGENGFNNETKTFRTVTGLEGEFQIGERDFNWEFSGSFGRADAEVETFNIKDVEFALAIDTRLDPNTGQIVCRSRVEGAPATLQGVSPNLVRVTGPDGIPTEQIFTPTPTPDQILGCQPLNPFGFNQMSQAAKDYVLGRQLYKNRSEQIGAQAFVSGSLFELPAGPLGFSVAAEWRTDELNFNVDELSRLGRTRTAAIAQTGGKVETIEGGIEFRIPIFGGEWDFPGLRNFEINPGARWVKQDGSGPTYRTLSGQLRELESDGDFENIWSVALSWQPIDDVTLRGNVSRSIRQPGVVELFLGGQPAFVTPTDPCGNQNITSGPNPTLRRQNCVQAVINAMAPGVTDAASANTFLNSFVAQQIAVQGTFSGSPSLKPEEGDSWTAGIVLKPRFISNFEMSFDYIDLDLKNIIIPTNLNQALNFCYDSPLFPDNTSAVGANTCTFFVRDPAFQITNGFASGFLNLSATRLRAVNAALRYNVNLSDLAADSNSDFGKLTVRANVYNLREYAESSSGAFDDTQTSNGRTDRPEYETQMSVAYDRGPLDLLWTWNWTDSTKLFNAGTPGTIENFSVLEFPSYSIHSFSAGYDITEKVRAQLTVDNVFDKNYAGTNGFLAGAFEGVWVDQIGRRWSLSVNMDLN